LSFPADGRDPTHLTQGPANDRSPQWSPDGERIAFVRRSGNSIGLWVISAAGGAPDSLIADSEIPFPATGYTPTWSPDGRRLAIRRPSGVWIVPVDAAAPTLLAALIGWAGEPQWSVDGKWIAIANGMDSAHTYMRLLSPTSRRSTQITTGARWDQHPRWSRTGGRLVFQSSEFEGATYELRGRNIWAATIE
jgi:Tol biopolymer transport system component